MQAKKVGVLLFSLLALMFLILNMDSTEAYSRINLRKYSNLIIPAQTSNQNTNSRLTLTASVIDGTLSVHQIDLDKNELAKGNFSLTKYARVRLSLYDASNKYLKTIYQNENGLYPGSYSGDWNGTDQYGFKVPAGVYHIEFEAKDYYYNTIGKDVENITVLFSTTTNSNSNSNLVSDDSPIAVSENGQIVEGSGASNYSLSTRLWGSPKFAAGFIAEKTGQIKSIVFQWKINNSTGQEYSGGDLGRYNFSIVTADANKKPSTNVIASVLNVFPQSYAGSWNLSFPSAALQAGANYFLVIENISADPATNFGSINTLTSKIRLWDGTGGIGYINGEWRPYTDDRNPWGNGQSVWQNGSRVPLILNWEDGTVTGSSYYYASKSGYGLGDAAPRLSGGQQVGEEIYWSSANKTISKLGFALIKESAGQIKYNLSEKTSGNIVSSGFLPDFNQSYSYNGVAIPTWTYANLASSALLEKGKTYILWLETTGSYQVWVPVCDSDQYNLSRATWGGSMSHFIKKQTSGSWQSIVFTEGTYNMPGENGDLVFSLQ